MSEAQLISEARQYMAECNYDSGADEAEAAAMVAEMTDSQVKRAIQRRYDGGWAQFARDCE